MAHPAPWAFSFWAVTVAYMSEYISIPVHLAPIPWGWIAVAGFSALLALAAGTVLLLARGLGQARAVRHRRRLLWGILAFAVALGGVGVGMAVEASEPAARERQALVLRQVERTWDVEVLLPATLPASAAEGEYRVPVLVSGSPQPSMCTLATYDVAGSPDTVEVSLWCNGNPAPRK